MQPPETDRQCRLARTVVVVTLSFYVLLACVVVAPFVSGPIVSVSPIDRSTIASLFPEGFAFFTRDAREDRFHYFVKEEEWTQYEFGPNGRPEYLGGIARTARARLGEVEVLRTSVPDQNWAECDYDWTACLASQEDNAIPLTFEFDSEVLCGTVGIVAAEPVPWAWRDSVERQEMPSKAAVLEVECSS